MVGAITAAPTTPERSPAEPGRCAAGRWPAAATGGTRPRGRRPAAGRRPATATPPITMTLGLSRLTALASTSPIVRPASRTSGWRAPSRHAHERHDVAAGARRRRRRRRSRPATAAPLATASRQPTLPHRQTASTSWGTWMWPRSPAAPWAPRRSAPSLMIPLPMPVATLTNSRWSTSREGDGVLAERHHVDVVVDDDDAVAAVADEAGDVEPVPARHDRRVGRPPGGVLDRAGQPDADGGELVRAAARRAATSAAAVLDDPATARPRGRGRCPGRRARWPGSWRRGR